MDCSKQFSLEVITPSQCPDWDTLLWGVASQFNATFTPNSATGATFVASLNNGVSQAGGTGNITVNSTATCDAQIDITITGQTIPGSGLCVLTVSLLAPLVQLMCFVGVTARPAGVYNAPFTIPSTGGVNRTLRVQFGLTHGGGGDLATGFTGIISNV